MCRPLLFNSWRAVLSPRRSCICFSAGTVVSRANRLATCPVQQPARYRAVLGAIGEERASSSSSRAIEWTFFFQASNSEETTRRDDCHRPGHPRQPRVRQPRALFDHLATTGGPIRRATPRRQAEILRVLRPGGVAHVGNRQVVKPIPEGTDAWSHPYHTPDNNTLSTDRLARAPYLTQFMAEPMFSPMPEVTVAAGGRVFKACGHIAHKKNQNQQLNTLLGINGYNGTILWTRPLAEGFMIHRNTMIATPEVLYPPTTSQDNRRGAGKTTIVVDHPQADGPV